MLEQMPHTPLAPHQQQQAHRTRLQALPYPDSPAPPSVSSSGNNPCLPPMPNFPPPQLDDEDQHPPHDTSPPPALHKIAEEICEDDQQQKGKEEESGKALRDKKPDRVGRKKPVETPAISRLPQLIVNHSPKTAKGTAVGGVKPHKGASAAARQRVLSGDYRGSLVDRRPARRPPAAGGREVRSPVLPVSEENHSVVTFQGDGRNHFTFDGGRTQQQQQQEAEPSAGKKDKAPSRVSKGISGSAKARPSGQQWSDTNNSFGSRWGNPFTGTTASRVGSQGQGSRALGAISSKDGPLGALKKGGRGVGGPTGKMGGGRESSESPQMRGGSVGVGAGRGRPIVRKAEDGDKKKKPLENRQPQVHHTNERRTHMSPAILPLWLVYVLSGCWA